jgi:hypothetical protein
VLDKAVRTIGIGEGGRGGERGQVGEYVCLSVHRAMVVIGLKKGLNFFPSFSSLTFDATVNPPNGVAMFFVPLVQTIFSRHCRAKQVMIVNFDTFLINLIYHNNLLCYECALKVTPTATLIGFYRDESFVLSMDSDFEYG